MDLVFSGQQLFGLFPGDFTGVALGHDLDVLIIQLVEQIEDAGDGKTDGGDQGIDDPQTVDGLGALLNVQRLQFGEIGSLDADPAKQTQQEQSQGGGDGGGDLHGEGLDRKGDAGGADAGLVLAVLSAVRCKHEGQNTNQAQRHSADAGENQEHRSVFKADEIDDKAQDHIDDIAPEEDFKLVHLLTKKWDGSTNQQGRHKAEHTG